MYVIFLFYYIHIHIYNTSLGCLLFVYFIFSYGLGRDFTWGDPILGDLQHMAPPVAHALHDDDDDADANVINGDLGEAIDDALWDTRVGRIITTPPYGGYYGLS